MSFSAWSYGTIHLEVSTELDFLWDSCESEWPFPAMPILLELRERLPTMLRVDGIQPAANLAH